MNSTEKEYETKLKVLRQHYDQRMQLLNEKVAQIYREISEDEVVATMREDEASNEYTSLRLKEICENNLAIEREETIDSLINELAETRATNEQLTREHAAANDFIEKAEGLLNLGRPNEASELPGKFSSLLSELQNSVSALSQDTEKAKSQLNEHSKKIREKTEENELLANELKGLRKESEKLSAENSRLNVGVLEITQQKRAAEERTEALEKDWNVQFEHLHHENANLKETVLKLEREHLDNESIRKTLEKKLDNDKQKYSENAESRENEYKAKSTQLKKKILELKNRTSTMSKDLYTKELAVENTQRNYEQIIKDLTYEVSKVKQLWEQKFREAEEQHSAKLTKANESQRKKLAELKQHYQGILATKSADLENENSSKLRQMRETEHQLTQKYESTIENEYILKSQHSHILNEELSNLRSLNFNEIRKLEEEHSTDLSRKLRETRRVANEELETAEHKLRQIEENNLLLTSMKREIEYKLELANQKIEGLNSRLAAAKEETGELQTAQRALSKSLEESQEAANEHRMNYQQEQMKNSRLEADSELLIRKSKDLDEFLQHTQSQALSLKKELEEKLLSAEFTIKQLEKSRSSLELDLNSLAESSKSIQSEKQELIRLRGEESQEFEDSLKSLRKGAAEQYEKEIQGHIETKRELREAEKDLKLAQSTISALQEQLSRSADSNQLAQDELKSRFRNENGALLDKSIASKKRLKKVIEKVKYDFHRMQQESYDHLKRLKTRFASELLNASHILQQKIQKNQSLQNTSKSESLQEIKTLHRKLKDSKELYEASIQENSHCLREKAENQKSTVTFLRNELDKRDQEIFDLTKRTDEYLLERSFIEDDKAKLERDLNDIILTLESQKRNTQELQQRHTIDFQEYKAELLKTQRTELSELLSQLEQLKTHSFESLTFFSEKISELQSLHKEECNSLAAYFEEKLLQLQQTNRACSGQLKERDNTILKLQDSLQGLEQKTNEVLAKIEVDLLDFQETLSFEKEWAAKYKVSSTSEIELLRCENKKVQAVVEGLKDVIERLEDDKELLRKEIRLQRDWLEARELEGGRGRSAHSQYSGENRGKLITNHFRSGSSKDS